MDKQHIAKFESQIKEFNNSLRQLTGGDSLDGLIKVIHQPGGLPSPISHSSAGYLTRWSARRARSIPSSRSC
jgi:hypothetical protein